MPHEIRIIRERKKDFLELLLLADEQENMIELYLDRGELFALYDGGLKSVCVVTEETSDTCELKNLATLPAYQRQGYARALIRHISQYYRGHYRTMLVGTGETHTLLLRIVRIRPLAPYTGFFHRPLPPFDRRRGNHA